MSDRGMPDHLRLVSFGVRINYAAFNPHAKRDDEAWPRRDWFISDQRMTVQAPTNDAELREMCAQLATALYRELRRRPLLSMRKAA